MKTTQGFCKNHVVCSLGIPCSVSKSHWRSWPRGSGKSASHRKNNSAWADRGNQPPASFSPSPASAPALQPTSLRSLLSAAACTTPPPRPGHGNRVDRHVHVVTPPLFEPPLLLPVGVVRGSRLTQLVTGRPADVKRHHVEESGPSANSPPERSEKGLCRRLCLP